VRQAVADAAQTERGILARRGGDALLAPEVVGPDDDRMRRRGPQQALVRGALLLDTWRARQRAEVEELRAEEADALGRKALERRDLFRELQVRADGDGDAVGGDRGPPRAAAQAPAALPVLPHADEAPAQPLAGRGDVHDPPVAVDDDRAVGRH